MENKTDFCIEINRGSENHISTTEKISLAHNHAFQKIRSRKSRKGKTIPGFAREIIVKVAEICEQEGSKNIALFSLNAPTRRAAIYTGVSERTIQRIRVEDRKRKSQEDSDVNKHKTTDYLEKEVNPNLKRGGRKGKLIPNSARDIISRVAESCYKEFENGEYLAPLVCRTRRAALYTGVSVRTIQRIKQEDEARNKFDQERFLTTPGTRRKRSTFLDRIDAFDYHFIRVLIDDLILDKKVFPTCSSLLKIVKESRINFPYGEDTLSRLLHSKGFTWRSGHKGKRVLVEKEDIFLGRANCVRQIKRCEAEGKLVVYLDDKFIGIGGDNTFCDKNSIFGAEGGIRCSGRLIVLTEFTAIGMAESGFRTFGSNSNASYFELTPTVSAVEKWLKQNLFPNIPAQSLIVMSSRACDNYDKNVPNEYSNKAALMQFLKHKKLKHDHAHTWVELYDIVKKHLEKESQEWTEIDKIIEQHGHVALRLPVYMSEFTPIELAYADINRYIRSKIIPSKASLDVIKEITLEAVNNFHINTFRGYLDHVVNMENYFLQNEKRMKEHYDTVTKKDPKEYSLPHSLENANSSATDVKVNAGTDTGRTNMFASLSPHCQIIYGKTIATPVVDKSVAMGQSHESDAMQPGPSYLNL